MDNSNFMAKERTKNPVYQKEFIVTLLWKAKILKKILPLPIEKKHDYAKDWQYASEEDTT